MGITIYENMELAAARKRSLIQALSHGEKQWLEIGMLLVQQPEIMLLDEPVAGMGRKETDRTGRLLKEISEKCSVIVVEHDMSLSGNMRIR